MLRGLPLALLSRNRTSSADDARPQTNRFTDCFAFLPSRPRALARRNAGFTATREADAPYILHPLRLITAALSGEPTPRV